MNWDWRSDVADIDREEAFENLATLYDGLIAKYDHLVLAYNVLVQIYGDSDLSDDGIDATGATDGPVQDVQDEQVSVGQPLPAQANPTDTDEAPLATAGSLGPEETEAGPTKLCVPNGYTRHECELPVSNSRSATPRIPRGAIPKGFARCESGKVVKTGEVTTPGTNPCKTWRCKTWQVLPHRILVSVRRIHVGTESGSAK